MLFIHRDTHNLEVFDHLACRFCMLDGERKLQHTPCTHEYYA